MAAARMGTIATVCVCCFVLGCNGAVLHMQEQASPKSPSVSASMTGQTFTVAGRMFGKVLESGVRIATSRLPVPVSRNGWVEGAPVPEVALAPTYAAPEEKWGETPSPGEHGLTISYKSESDEGHMFKMLFDNPARCKKHEEVGDNECQFRFGERVRHKGEITLSRTMGKGSTIETLINYKLKGVMSTMFGQLVQPVFFKCALCGAPCLVDQGATLPKVSRQMPPCPVQVGTVISGGNYTRLPSWSPQMDAVEFEQEITETTRNPDGTVALRSTTTVVVGPFK